MLKLRLRRVIARNFARAIQALRIFIYRQLSDNSVYGTPQLFQPAQFVGRGKIEFEDNVSIGVVTSPMFFSTYAYFDARKPSSYILIGKGTWINNNFRVISDSGSIKIGRGCLIGSNVEIINSNFHSIVYENRGDEDSVSVAPVCIGDNVFVGSNVKILKGVTVGSESVIGNGAVVTKNVPSKAIVGGNPARTIKMID